MWHSQAGDVSGVSLPQLGRCCYKNGRPWQARARLRAPQLEGRAHAFLHPHRPAYSSPLCPRFSFLKPEASARRLEGLQPLEEAGVRGAVSASPGGHALKEHLAHGRGSWGS